MIKKQLTLEEQIELVRRRMYEAYDKDPSGCQVLRLSQQLDQLLNEWQRESSRTSRDNHD